MYERPVDKLERVQIRAHWNDANFENLPQNEKPRRLNLFREE